ncbi:MFS transporter [Campylobacter sp. MIT 97-5078]|nr:MFS transporter [Campylobacter sp. MIT 97-5078]
MLAILLAVFVVPSSISGTAIALPFIAQELGNNVMALQWVVNAFNLFFASFTLIWGAMADRFGAKRCLLVGVCLCVWFFAFCCSTRFIYLRYSSCLGRNWRCKRICLWSKLTR